MCVVYALGIPCVAFGVVGLLQVTTSRSNWSDVNPFAVLPYSTPISCELFVRILRFVELVYSPQAINKQGGGWSFIRNSSPRPLGESSEITSSNRYSCEEFLILSKVFEIQRTFSVSTNNINSSRLYLNSQRDVFLLSRKIWDDRDLSLRVSLAPITLRTTILTLEETSRSTAEISESVSHIPCESFRYYRRYRWL